MNLNANQARNAMLDYDAYFKAVNGQVNDMFYYYREQAALKARQYQRALDDIAKAIELNPKDLQGFTGQYGNQPGNNTTNVLGL